MAIEAGTRVRFLDPTPDVDPTRVKQQRPVEPLPSLSGRVLGVIAGGGGDSGFFAKLGQALQDVYGLKEVLYHRKPFYRPAPAEVYDDFASKCDAVITGVCL